MFLNGHSGRDMFFGTAIMMTLIMSELIKQLLAINNDDIRFMFVAKPCIDHMKLNAIG